MADTTNYYVCNRCGKPCEVYQGRPTGTLEALRMTVLSECCRARAWMVSSKDKEP